ncbi:hypothetical protein AB6F08_04555 [Staphylococcus saprophyticus]|uniref:hypothetical protein n=1 Tax=Staphylococcus saprophyticus TaxID=29385 RepID=UPI0034DD9F9F
MKKLLFLVLASFLVLAACGNKEESRLEDNKEETKTSEKEKNKDDKKDEEKASKPDDNSNEDIATQDKTSEQQTKEEIPQSQENNKVDVSNITDRSVLESVIYGNYSEMEKINAYNSAVANGVIPQGNVMEGPASAAYESSLKVESGEDESVYEKNQRKDEPIKNNDVTIHEDGRQTYKDELGHDKNILTPEEEARQAEENDITPEERAEVEASLAE